MIIIGMLVIVGALIHISLFNIQLISLVYLVLGIVVAVAGRRFEKIISKLIFLGILLIGFIVIPFIVPNTSPLNEVNRSIRESSDFMEGKKYEEAEKVLSAALEKYPGVPSIYVNLSTSLLMQGKPQQAKLLLEEGNKILLMDGSALFNKAMAYYQEKDYEESLDILKNVLLQNPNMPEAWIYASETAARLKDLKAARYFATSAAVLWPEKADVRFHLAKIKLMTMEYNKADKQLEEALKLNPEPKLREEILKLKKETEYYRNRF